MCPARGMVVSLPQQLCSFIKLFLLLFKSRCFSTAYSLFAILSMCLLASRTYAQRPIYQLCLQVYDKAEKQPIPFARISIRQKTVGFTDLDGHICLQDTLPFVELAVRSRFHITAYFPAPDEDTIKAALVRKADQPLTNNDLLARRIIQKVIDNAPLNNPRQRDGFYEKMYSKTVVTTDQLKTAKDEFSDLFSFVKPKNEPDSVSKPDNRKGLLGGFNRLLRKLRRFNSPHHLLIVESASEKYYKNFFDQREMVYGTKVSGLEEASVVTATSKVQPLSVYDHFYNIASFIYISPVRGNAFKRYRYELKDRVIIGNDTLYVINFAPHNITYNTLHGQLIISSNQYAVKGFLAEPVQNDDLGIRLAQSYSLHNGQWFPVDGLTTFYITTTGLDDVDLKVSSRTFSYDIRPNAPIPDSLFDDKVIFDILPESARKDSVFWDSIRQQPLTLKEENTYKLYDTLGHVRNFRRLAQAGQRLYFGQIPLGPLNIDIGSLAGGNEHEGIRLGMQVSTSSRFSERLQLTAYGGYGFHDKEPKYAFSAGYFLIPDKLQAEAEVTKDIDEPGGFRFAFDRQQYIVENVRQIRFIDVDETRRQEFRLNIFPHPYLSLQGAISRQVNTPLYNYSYQKDPERQSFVFGELRAAARLSWGERFIKLTNDRMSIGTILPELWVQTTWGRPNVLGGQYSYLKFDSKIQQFFRVAGWGRSGVQLAAGRIFGDVPYPALYNMRGSYRAYALVSYNAFETMRYNEFAGDRYATMFFSHNFGRLIITPVLQPNFEMMHNAGWANISNNEKSLHNYNFKKMDKGYYESGIFVSDVVVVYAYAFRIGLGAGVFARYGPYTLPETEDNFVFKFAISWVLSDFYVVGRSGG